MSARLPTGDPAEYLTPDQLAWFRQQDALLIAYHDYAIVHGEAAAQEWLRAQERTR